MTCMPQGQEAESNLCDVADRIALVDEWVLSLTDHDSVSAGGDGVEPLPKGIDDGGDHIASLYRITQGGLKMQDAASLGTEPAALAGQLGLIRGGKSVVGHSEMGQHPSRSVSPDRNGMRIESESLAPVEEQHGCTGCGGSVTQRSVSDSGMQRNGRCKCGRQLECRVTVEVGPNLGKIGAVIRTSVEVDSDTASAHDLGHKEMGDPGCQRTAW